MAGRQKEEAAQMIDTFTKDKLVWLECIGRETVEGQCAGRGNKTRAVSGVFSRRGIGKLAKNEKAAADHAADRALNPTRAQLF
jgi:hypothetical protein